MTCARVDEVEALLGRLTEMARDRLDVRALALVGSWASGRPSSDSDVDVVLLTTSPSSYVDRDDWLGAAGGVRVVQTRRWGAVTERRFTSISGLEVELDVGTPAWASLDPLDAGTRRVVAGGIRPLYDPDGMLASLRRASG